MVVLAWIVIWMVIIAVVVFIIVGMCIEEGFRWAVIFILICVALGWAIITVNSKPEPEVEQTKEIIVEGRSNIDG